MSNDERLRILLFLVPEASHQQVFTRVRNNVKAFAAPVLEEVTEGAALRAFDLSVSLTEYV